VTSGADLTIAIATAVQAAAVTLAFLVARSQLRDAKVTRELQATQASKTLEATTRPFVTVELDALTHYPTIEFVIENHGKTLARNIRFEFDPPLSSSFDRGERLFANLPVFSAGLPSLAPGRRLRLHFDVIRGDKPPTVESRVTVTYDGATKTGYTDSFDVDLDHTIGASLVGGPDRVGSVARELRELRRALERSVGPRRPRQSIAEFPTTDGAEDEPSGDSASVTD
jgi:hypothetical protein